ncbi:unnamed protein product, partial [Owenia fusiformis]
LDSGMVGTRIEGVAVNTTEFINRYRWLPQNVTLELMIRKLNETDKYNDVKIGEEMVGSGVVGILSYLSCDNTDVISEICGMNSIPHIAMHNGDCRIKEGSDFTISLRPHSSYIEDAIVDITFAEEWNNVVIFYDKSYGRTMISRLFT